jgi:hypothetical protein
MFRCPLMRVIAQAHESMARSRDLRLKWLSNVRQGAARGRALSRLGLDETPQFEAGSFGMMVARTATSSQLELACLLACS